ncbi:hypothetical protein THAOC_32165, partial [Thalassiosira oceanica]
AALPIQNAPLLFAKDVQAAASRLMTAKQGSSPRVQDKNAASGKERWWLVNGNRYACKSSLRQDLLRQTETKDAWEAGLQTDRSGSGSQNSPQRSRILMPICMGVLLCFHWSLTAAIDNDQSFCEEQDVSRNFCTEISNYDTNKTRLDEAPFGRADDDNGPGSEPPPHDHKRYVSTFITSRRRSPAAVGKPSFPRFKVYYLPRRRVQVRAETVGLARRRSPWCEDVREIRRHLHQSPETEDWLEPPRVSVDGLLRAHQVNVVYYGHPPTHFWPPSTLFRMI